jgi:dihydrofolate synthase/folylpolyglutamate synthase
MSYDDALDYLYRLQWHGIQPGLERMKTLLSFVDHPERQFRSIHIGGTNGKGSTAAMVASVLTQAGYRTGLYTSPHLIDFSERIRILGRPIPAGEMARLTGRLRAAIEARAPHLAKEVTFFEFTTAIAFLYFAEAKIDLAVVEVGMGGRFDATNLLTPLVSAITQIDLDHERYLGSTILKIASEKAGIIKEQTPVVTAASQPEVLSLFQRVARFNEAPLIRLGHEIAAEGILSKDLQETGSPQRFFYRGKTERRVEISLLGRHQIDNAAVALGILEQLQERGVSLTEEDILLGMKQARWEGRLEVIRRNPLILLDGAHNRSGAKALGLFLTGVDPGRKGKHWLIAGIMQDKNIVEILDALTPWADEVVLTRPDMERAADPGLLAASLKEKSLCRTRIDHLPDAIAYVESHLQPEDALIITGSLYMVGEAKAFFSGTIPSLIRG